MMARERFWPWDELRPLLYELQAASNRNDVVALRSVLQSLVSGYQPAGEVVDWIATAQRA